jgi:ATP-dependent protease ClpP protease subunit
MIRKVAIIMSIFTFLAAFAPADTFTHRKNGDVLHGYATSKITDDGLTIIQTSEKGNLPLNLREYTVKSDANGRNDTVAVITIDDEISLEIETDAFEKAITAEADKGPLFILIEIDTPGGRVDLAKRMCSAITGTRNCTTVAFINGGQFGGALSAGAAISFACNEIYMAPETVIGAATMIVSSPGGMPMDIKDVAGETIGEKMGSAWRNYLAALAQQNDRPGLLAKAMEDKDISVIEVSGNGKRNFIESQDKRASHEIIRTWSKAGTLLTLPSADAVTCGIADKTVSSREELLVDKQANTARVLICTGVSDATKLYKKVNAKFERLRLSINTRLHGFAFVRTRPAALRLMRELIVDTKQLMMLKKRYPDIPVSEENLRMLLADVEGAYKGVKTVR